jgi:alpha-L-rhamnosidase
MNSRNHFALGSVGSWYFQSLAGIHYDPRMPGFKRIAVRPLPIEGLTDAEATYHSMFGPIRSAWRIEGSRFRLDLLIPPNTTGALSLPADRDRPVTESDQPIEKADGVRFLGWNETPYGMTADCELGSGRYRFASTLPAGR